MSTNQPETARAAYSSLGDLARAWQTQAEGYRQQAAAKMTVKHPTPAHQADPQAALVLYAKADQLDACATALAETVSQGQGGYRHYRHHHHDGTPWLPPHVCDLGQVDECPCGISRQITGDGPVYTWPAVDAQAAWEAEQAARGDLAGSPHQMPCYQCGAAAKVAGQHYDLDDLTLAPYVTRVVVKLGPVTGKADPTQTYVLGCGHTVI